VRKPAPRQRAAEHPTAEPAPAVLFAGPPDDPGVDHDDESGPGASRARLY
jgi:uncharacterized membrane-anchored protein